MRARTIETSTHIFVGNMCQFSGRPLCATQRIASQERNEHTTRTGPAITCTVYMEQSQVDALGETNFHKVVVGGVVGVQSHVANCSNCGREWQRRRRRVKLCF